MTTDLPARLGRWMRGIRVRIVVTYLVLFAVSLLAALLVIRQVLLIRVTSEAELGLAQEVEELQLLADGVDPETGEPFGSNVEALFDTFLSRNIPSEGEVLVTLVDGEMHDASPRPAGAALATPDLVGRWSGVPQPTWGDADTQLGEVRWLAVPVQVGADGAGTFVVAMTTGVERAEVNQAVGIMGGVSAAVLVVASILGWLAAARVVAPIRRLTQTANAISETDLSERIPVSGDDEVAELTATFNAMLTRIESAFAGQRRFLDDLGHELRTPITIIRGHLELLPDDPAERQEALAVCLDELDVMARQVDDLMTLAKAERPDFLALRPVDVAELTDRLEARAVALAPDRRWVIEHLAPVTIEADPERLVQAMANLVTNAAQHTEPGAEIRIGSKAVADTVHLWVADRGPGIDPAERDAIFERFRRGRRSQVRRREGSGLGLSIVAAIAAAHGGRVVLDSVPGAGATFTLVLPMHATPPDQEAAPPDDGPDTTRVLDLEFEEVRQA